MFDVPTLMKILLKLPFEEVIEKQLVCKHFRDIITDSFFWSKKVELDYGLDSSKIQKGFGKKIYFFYEEMESHSIKKINEWNKKSVPIRHFKRAIYNGNMACIKAYFRWGGTEYLNDNDILALLGYAIDYGEWDIYWYFIYHYLPKSFPYSRFFHLATSELLLRGVEDDRIFILIDKAGGHPDYNIEQNMGGVKSVEFLLDFHRRYCRHSITLDINIFKGIGKYQNVELFEKCIKSIKHNPLHIRYTLLGAVEYGHLEFVIYLTERYPEIIGPSDILFAIKINVSSPDPLILKYALLLARDKGYLQSLSKMFEYYSRKDLLEIIAKITLTL